MTEICAVPAKHGCRIRVNFELRYGMLSLKEGRQRRAAQPKQQRVLLVLRRVLRERADDRAEGEQAGQRVSARERSRKRENTYLVLMYFPSRVRSLSLVAFSDPAKSIRLCRPSSAIPSQSNTTTTTTHQHRRLHAPPPNRLQLHG